MQFEYGYNGWVKPVLSVHLVGHIDIGPLYSMELQSGWEACRHPEGALFYMNSRTACCTSSYSKYRLDSK